MTIILQVFRDASGRFGGRILRDGIEDGCVEACATYEDVECQAIEAGIYFDYVEKLKTFPSMT